MLKKIFPTVFMAVTLLMLARLMVPRVVASPPTITFIVNSTFDVTASAPTFTVNSLGDAPADFAGDPDYIICRTNPSNSTCTLRAALMNANRFAGGGATIIIPGGRIRSA